MRCVYNGLEHPEIMPYLLGHNKKNCMNCKYEYPCENISFFKETKLRTLLDDLKIEQKIKSGFYQTANL